MGKKSQFFRAGVGVVVIRGVIRGEARGKSEVLAFRRADGWPNAWQLPQGGIDKGEEPEAAMWRELEEETGLTQASCELIAVSKGWLAYELPESLRGQRKWRGQVQRWYLCRFTGNDSDIQPDGKEFCEWKWMDIDQLVADVIEFRQPTYRALAVQFAEYLSGNPE